jgi:hypothetical protein
MKNRCTGLCPMVAALAITGCGGGGAAYHPAQAEASPSEVQDTLKKAAAVGSQITVVARGSLAANVGPLMEVVVDGASVGQLEIRKAEYEPYSFYTAQVLRSGAKIDVIFKNDAFIAGADRNLYVQSIAVDGKKTMAADSGVVYDRGVVDGVDVVAGQEDMLWSGALRFVHNAVSQGLTVRAKGSQVGGQGPLMSILVNGQTVSQRTVSNTAYEDFHFNLPNALPPGSKLAVVFSNDLTAGTEDRNLYVESITANGETQWPTAPGVLYDRGLVDGVDVTRGRVDMLWNGGLIFNLSATPHVDITAFGAVCDGRFDNGPAITRAIASAKNRGLPVFIPAGTCAYGRVLRLDGVTMLGTGDGSVLHALDPLQEAIFLTGSGAQVSQLKLSGVKATVRQAAWEATRITAYGATDFVIDNVTIDGSAAGGIQTAKSARNGSITRNRITGTLSDSIHLTDNASYITVAGNRIEDSGDDGIAVVSYRRDPGIVNHIVARDNVIRNNKWGRQMSVVGGSDVLYENNHLSNNLASAACLYIAQESSYATHGVSNVTARRNTLVSCGGASTGHGAVMLYTSGEEANTGVSLVRNDVVQTGQPGIRIFGAMNTDITVDSNRVQGANPAVSITTPGVNFIPYTSGPVGYVAP